MYPLERFLESDVNESPTIDTVVPNKFFARFFPGWSFIVMVTSFFGHLFYGKARVAQGRAKIRRARAEILPRNPEAVVCPQCYEVLERLI